MVIFHSDVNLPQGKSAILPQNVHDLRISWRTWRWRVKCRRSAPTSASCGAAAAASSTQRPCSCWKKWRCTASWRFKMTLVNFWWFGTWFLWRLIINIWLIYGNIWLIYGNLWLSIYIYIGMSSSQLTFIFFKMVNTTNQEFCGEWWTYRGKDYSNPSSITIASIYVGGIRF